MIRIDVVVAVRNEEETLEPFLRKIAALSLPTGVELKVIFVEDSSTDRTRSLLHELARSNRSVTCYMLARGFGQSPAIAFGLSRSTADAVVMMDVDGSHPVDVIPDMVRAYLDGAEVVQCVRKSFANRKASRRIGAVLFHALVRFVTGISIEDQNMYFRLVSADVARHLWQTPRYSHYLRFPLPRHRPGAVRKLYVDTEERRLGQSQYNLWRLARLAADAILSLISPLRFVLITAVAAACAFALLASGWRLVGLLIVAAAAWAVNRYRSLLRPILPLMRIEQSGNAEPTRDVDVSVPVGIGAR